MVRAAAGILVAHMVVFSLSSDLLADDFSQLRDQFLAHCVRCHGQDGVVEGNVNLLSVQGAKDPLSRPELLQKLIRVVEDREMPPADEPQPSLDVRTALAAQLKTILAETLRSYPFDRTPMRRMNRFQYNNAVVDLLELDRDIFQLNERLMRRRDDYFDPATRSMPSKVRVSCRPLSKDIDNQRPEGFRGVAAFPQDQRAEHGFDNRADHLTLSPLLMEAFLELSQSVAGSPDLNDKECRSWSWLFAAPAEESIDDGGMTSVIRERVGRLLRRAFRRSIDAETRESFVRFAEAQLAAGASFEQTMRAVVGAVLAMPEFLYFHDEPADGSSDRATTGREPVSDFELASRLALFLWSSIPDDTLLDLADAGRLSDPDTLGAQIDRMLDDRRTGRFCDNFPSQWLQLDRLITAIPDREMYPYFYYHGYRTSMHMMSEPLLLFETVYIEDRSILDLLAPDFTWQSEMLRQNYEGVSASGHDVQVQTFERVAIDHPRRGGVITNAAVMTMTSTPTRTQPITRGAWLNEVVFNDPPEPPPADVPPLPEVDHEQLAKLTIRERLAVHRQRADCAACHNRIDPLGFALENFGPTGVWRDKYENGRDVDVSGLLFNQYEFTTLEEFKSLLVRHKQRFIRAFASHLMSYALGRQPGPADGPALDEITERAVNGEDHMRTILKAVAMSDPFRHKNASTAD
ncbi:MAG: DUF1592 domain-containing protein [Planctomycetaceae bacterium]